MSTSPNHRAEQNKLRHIARSICHSTLGISLLLLPDTLNAQPTMRDMAVAELRNCDKNYNGRIDPSEVMLVRNAQHAAAKSGKRSFLYMFDDNSNGAVDETEILNVRFTPSTHPAKKKTESIFKTPPPKGPSKKKGS